MRLRILSNQFAIPSRKEGRNIRINGVVTAKTVEQAKTAERKGADYLGSGAVFGSTTKLDAKPMSKELLKEITSSVDIPVVAIGGINAENAKTLKGTGIDGIAVVGGIFANDDIKLAAEQLANICDEL